VDEALLAREREDAARDSTTIVFVGRLIPEKGVDDLLEAYLALPDVPDLVFVGDGERRAPMESRVGELGLGHKVRFTGFIPHDAALEEIAAADVLALPSYAEGCPLTVLEALALGTPVVGSAVGAIPDFLPETLLVEPGDVGALSAVLAELVVEPERRQLLGREGRVQIHGCCTWPRVAERVEGMYREALAGSSREGGS
jgi:glycosyltransferase involved in cell wall biosynthesis